MMGIGLFSLWGGKVKLFVYIGPIGLGNGPLVWIMAFEVMTHSGLCHSDNSRLCCLVFSRSC